MVPEEMRSPINSFDRRFKFIPINCKPYGKVRQENQPALDTAMRRAHRSL
jgi:hypothetical protein